MWNVANITSTSITIEINNHACYYADKNYILYLNGEEKDVVKTNVYTIYQLEPATSYEIKLVAAEEEFAKEVATLSETAILNVKDFGATGDGVTIDTAAFQTAIMVAPEGSRIVVPEGTYKLTPIFLKSHMTLELQKGAVLLGHESRDVYPILPDKITNAVTGEETYISFWEGDPAASYASIVTAIGVKDVRIIGEGTIDGNGQNGDWWIDCKVKRGAWRPRSLYIVNCEDITVVGITIKNSPSWTVHPVRSTRLHFINMTLQNPKDSPNTDGIDPESCDDIDILGVRFSLGDDCIAIKSGKFSVPKEERRPSENIRIKNCLMEFGHGAVVLGSEMTGGIKNIYVERCLFRNTDRGLRVKTRRGRGNTAVIDDILVKDIKMEGVLTPFTVNSFYFCDPDGETEYVWSKEKLPVDDRTPLVGTLRYENIDCVDAEVCAGFIYGLPEQKIKQLTLKNVNITFKDEAVEDFPEMLSFQEKIVKAGFIIRNVEKFELQNVIVNNHVGDAVMLQDVDDYLAE